MLLENEQIGHKAQAVTRQLELVERNWKETVCFVSPPPPRTVNWKVATSVNKPAATTPNIISAFFFVGNVSQKASEVIFLYKTTPIALAGIEESFGQYVLIIIVFQEWARG